MESLIGEIAALQNQQRLLTAAMDEQIQSIRQHYWPNWPPKTRPSTKKCNSPASGPKPTRTNSAPARSIETVHGAVGWRTGQPALKTLPAGPSTACCKPSNRPAPSAYIRVKEEVHKQNLLSDRDAIGPEKLRQFGLRVVQEEAFFVEPKLTEVAELA